MSQALAGLLAEFARADELDRAAHTAHRAGYRALDAFSPFPIEGLAEAVGIERDPLPAFVFIAACVGALLGFGMQYFSAVVGYPINVGGRPYNSWPAFVPVIFEMAVLFAALTAVFGMLAFNGLPKLRHPVFAAPAFARASQDRFFLWIAADDPLFDVERTRVFLTELKPAGIVEVAHDEER